MKLLAEKLIQEVKPVRSLDLGTDSRPETEKGSIGQNLINSQLTQFPKHQPFVRPALDHDELMYHQNTNQTIVHRALAPGYATSCRHMTVRNPPIRRQ